MAGEAPSFKGRRVGRSSIAVAVKQLQFIKEKRRCTKSTNLNSLAGGLDGGGNSAWISALAIALASTADVK